MKNIIFDLFDSVFTLESFLLAINLKLENKQQEKELKEVLHNLSSILIAFDFEFKGNYNCYVDKRFSYEQLVYLCFLKINESTNVPRHQSHLFKTNLGQNADVKLNLTDEQIERKLNTTDNLAVMYFMDKCNDGAQWRKLHSLVGSSVLKYLFLYAWMFKTVNSSSKCYVQVCGARINFFFRSITGKKFKTDEKVLTQKILNNNKCATKMKPSNEPNNTAIAVAAEESKKPTKKPTNLNAFFKTRDGQLMDELDRCKTASHQLDVFGHQAINRKYIFYDRNVSNNIPKKFFFADKSKPANVQSKKIIDELILKDLNFELYPHKDKLDEMKAKLNDILVKFVSLNYSCPFRAFLESYVNKKKKNEAIISQNNDEIRPKPIKRKRDEDPSTYKCPQTLPSSSNVEPVLNLKSIKVEPKDVFCFIRRCLMYVLEYKDKTGKIDTTCQLVGGKHNLNLLLKQLKKILNGLKHDSFNMNSLMHGLKLSRMSFLAPIECDRYKRLILMATIRWFFESYVFILVKAHFYVTDTSKTNSELFFYTKRDWKHIVEQQLSKKHYKSMYNLEKIKESDVVAYCSRFESNGVYLGRLLPKNVNNECRIISGVKVYNPCTKKTSNNNYKFLTLNTGLNWLINVDPNLIGFACRDHKHMSKRFVKFLSYNSLNRDECSFKKWNFLKFDVDKCFDSINSQELIQYVSELFNQHLGVEYCFSVIRFCKLEADLDKKHLKPKYDFLAVRHHVHDRAFVAGSWDFMQALIKNNMNFNKNTIYVPLSVHDRNINARKLNNSLKKCLEHIVIKIHNGLYERMNGVLQGSVCSRNLCDLYLGKIESKSFEYRIGQHNASDSRQHKMILNPANELIMRVVDDYLVISNDRERLFNIIDILKQYVALNQTKTVIHLWSPLVRVKQAPNDDPPEHSWLKLAPELMEDMEGTIVIDNDEKEVNLVDNCSNIYFPWCGLNIDVHALDVYFNFDKYFESGNLTNRINQSCDYRFPFMMFNLKFLRLFSANVSNLVLNTNVNHFTAILRNLVDMFALSCIRFMILYKKVMPRQVTTNVRMQIRIVLNLCYFLNSRLNNRLKKTILNYFYSTLSMLKFICLRTYCLIFIKFNKPQHNRLLYLINRHLKQLNFVRFIRHTNNTSIFIQLIQLIEQQTKKFYICNI